MRALHRLMSLFLSAWLPPRREPVAIARSLSRTLR